MRPVAKQLLSVLPVAIFLVIFFMQKLQKFFFENIKFEMHFPMQ